MDQLCIKQNDDREIKETLAKIPDIYRTFEVAVFMPGALCECVPGSAEFHSVSDVASALSLEEKLSGCYNTCAYAGWLKRLWPRQELLYAKSLRVVWVGLGRAVCLREMRQRGEYDRLISGLDNAQMATRVWYEKIKADGYESGKELASAVLSVSEQAAGDLRENIRLWAQLHRSPNSANYIPLHLMFLLGMPLESEVQDITEEEDKLNRFLNQLRLLHDSRRAATEARDYVIAVWVDCPRYKIPEDYKTKPLNELLENAVLQLERNFSISLLTTVPAGLFEHRSGISSKFWRPTLYMDNHSSITQAEETICADTYGPVTPLTLRLNAEEEQSRLPFMNGMKQYDGVSGPVKTYYAEYPRPQDVLRIDEELMYPVADSWPFLVFSALERHQMRMDEQGHAKDTFSYGLTELLLGDPQTKCQARMLVARYLAGDQQTRGLFESGTGDTSTPRIIRMYEESAERRVKAVEPLLASLFQAAEMLWTYSPDTMLIDHGDAVYQICCAGLQIPYQMAKRLGLKLVLKNGNHTLLGLGRGSFNFNTSAVTITVEHDEVVEGFGRRLFEATTAEHETEVGIVAVWMPISDLPGADELRAILGG